MFSSISNSGFNTQNHPHSTQFGLSPRKWLQYGSNGLLASGSGISLYGASSNTHNMTDLAQTLKPFANVTVSQTENYLKLQPSHVKSQPLSEFLGVDVASSGSKTSFITSIVGLALTGLGLLGHVTGMVADKAGTKKVQSASNLIDEAVNPNPLNLLSTQK